MTDEKNEGIYTWASDATVAATYEREIGGHSFPSGHSGQHCFALRDNQFDGLDCNNDLARCLCELEGLLIFLVNILIDDC